jgi:hypothetical protein
MACSNHPLDFLVPNPMWTIVCFWPTSHVTAVMFGQPTYLGVEPLGGLMTMFWSRWLTYCVFIVRHSICHEMLVYSPLNHLRCR